MHPPTTAAPGGPGHVGAGASSACSYCQRTSGSLWFKATPARAGPAVAATRPLVTAIVVKRRRILCFMTVHLLSHPSPRALLAVTASAARCGSGSCRPGPARRSPRRGLSSPRSWSESGGSYASYSTFSSVRCGDPTSADCLAGNRLRGTPDVPCVPRGTERLAPVWHSETSREVVPLEVIGLASQDLRSDRLPFYAR